MKAKSALIATIATVGIASSANAQDFTSGGPTGINAGPHNIDIVIGASGIIADLDITQVWASHNWAGDINATLTHVDTGTSVVIFQNIGGPGFGYNANLSGSYRFDDASANSFWAAGLAAGTNNIASGTYYASGVGGAQTLLSAFNGENIQGTWRLSLLDTFPASTPGVLTSYTLHMTVPAPGALALLGLAGVVGRRRNRR